MAKLFGLSTIDILSKFDRLTDREQKIIYVVLGVLLFGFIGGGLYWIKKIGSERSSKIILIEKQMEEMAQKRSAYLDAKNRKSRFENNNVTDLFSYLVAKENNLALQSDIGEDVLGSTFGNFQQNNIPLSLRQSISIDKMTALLKEIEGINRDGVVKVISLKISSNSAEPDLLDASMTVATWNRKR